MSGRNVPTWGETPITRRGGNRGGDGGWGGETGGEGGGREGAGGGGEGGEGGRGGVGGEGWRGREIFRTRDVDPRYWRGACAGWDLRRMAS